jgi:hypothetical protein
MKTFFDLLATEQCIDIAMTVQTAQPSAVKIVVNNQTVFDQQVQNQAVVNVRVPLLEPVNIQVYHSGAYVRSLQFDQWESRPQWGQEQSGFWSFSTIDQPFYVWKHTATGQGWLLTP